MGCLIDGLPGSSICGAHTTDASSRWTLDNYTSLRVHDTTAGCQWFAGTTMIDSSIIVRIVRVVSASWITH